MTIISTILFILSTVGVLGFACWDNDIEIPVFYSFGKFEADWWFHDKLKPGKPHLESHAKDGPPLVARTGTGGPIPFPYPEDTLQSGATIPDTWGNKVKMSSTYTPVDGMYGVTKNKQTDRTFSLEYYPNASLKNDYIANRLLGPQADWSELEGMFDQLKIYNSKVFTDGDPFGPAKINGPGKPDDPRWDTIPLYQAAGPEPFMTPLTSTGTGKYPGTYAPGGPIFRSQNDYSGAEYSGGDPSFDFFSPEAKYTVAARSHEYQQDKDGNSLSPTQPNASAWAGEAYGFNQYIQNAQPNTNTDVIMGAFHDPVYDGATQTVGAGGSYTQFTPMGWGTSVTVPTDGTSLTGAYEAINNSQVDYIITQLNQENPIPSVDRTPWKGKGTGPVISN